MPRAKSESKQEKPAYSNQQTESVAAALQDPALRDIVNSRTTFAEVQRRIRSGGPQETEDGVSFFADELDHDQLDVLVDSLNG